MSKKSILSCMISLSIICMTFLGCNISKNTDETNTSVVSENKKIPEELFIFHTPTDEDAIEYYTETDSFEIIVVGGPYYMGAKHLYQPAYEEFDKLLKEKINEATDLTNELFEKSVELKKAMEELKREYVEMWSIVLPEAKNLEKASREVASYLVEYQVREEALVAAYNSIKIESNNDPIVVAFFEYQKTGIAIELANIISEDFAYLLSSAVQIQMIFEESENSIISEAAKIFDEKLDIIENFVTKYDEMQDEYFKLDMALKQINTGQYYLGLASTAFIEEQMPAILKKAESFTPNDFISKEDMDFMIEYGEFMKEFASDTKKTLENVDNSYLINLEEIEIAYEYESTLADLFVSKAYGKKEQGYLESALKSLKSKARRASDAIYIGKEMTKAGLKTAWKEGKRTIGSLADGANVIIKSGFDYACGKANGLSMKEIKEQWGDNINEANKNYENYKSGAQVFKTGEEFFDWLEKTGGDATSYPVEVVIGKGNISWAMGHVGKSTVNMFTGFGKGMTKILNPDSSSGAIVEGALDVGLSFIGGSLVIFKGSQTLSGAKESIKHLGKRGLNFFGKVISDNNIQNLRNISKEILKNRKLTSEMVEKLYENALRIDANVFIKEKLVEISKNLNDEFFKLLKEGAGTFALNVAGGKESYKHFVETAFKNSLSGYKEALQGVLGESFKDYINNLVANRADDLFKTIVKDYIDKGLIPGIGGDFDGQYKGSVKESGVIIPIEISIFDNIVFANIKLSTTWMEEATITIDIEFSGSIDEEGVITTKVNKASLSLKGGEDYISCSMVGAGNGTISNESGSFTISGSVNCSGVLFGEPYSENQESIDPLTIGFTRVE